MFLGTPTGGNYQDTANFTGIWHAYVATTYNGGKSYVTVDATPNDPVQIGSICNMGTTCGADRNLLDFNDLTIDAQGRAVGAFADGCVVGSCDATSSSSASRSALGTILRQSGGKRLLAAFDPVEPAVPGAPLLVSALQNKNNVLLSWQAPDTGGAGIIAYEIYRGTSSGTETLIATTSSKKTSYLNRGTVAGTNYYYRVAAKNRVGTGPLCGEIETTPAPPVQSGCIAPGVTLVNDPTGDQVGAPANTELDIQSITVGEPFTTASTPNALTFTMKVENLASPVQPNAQWTMFFTAPNGTEYFVDMNTEGASTTPVFQYGHVTALATGNPSLTTDGTADPASTYNADGTITIIIDDSEVGSLVAGNQLVNIYGETQLLVGGGGTGLLETIDSTSAGRYIMLGNTACGPQAVLTANPSSGTAPLSVAFSASKSSDPAGNKITSYNFTFGDGTTRYEIHPVCETLVHEIGKLHGDDDGNRQHGSSKRSLRRQLLLR